MSDVVYAERVIERGPWGVIIRSELVPVGDVDPERDLDCVNSCGHVGVRCEPGWLFDFVVCAVCGEGLGSS